MDKLKLFVLNYKKIFVIVFGLVLIAFLCFIYYFNFSNNIDNKDKKNELIFNSVYTSSEFNNDNNDLIISNKLEEKNDEKLDIKEFISVDIKGRIKKPGVYKIDKSLDRRISDVVTMAGGLLNDADTSVTNLAKKIFDEMVIIIYSKEQVKGFSNVLEKENIQNDTCKKECDSCIEKDKTNKNDFSNEINNDESLQIKLININKASKEELMTLTGIGESKALAIISYREKTPFEKIEDIMNISGIKESAFEKIKDYITV